MHKELTKFRKEEFLLCVFFAVVPRSCRLIYLLNKVPNVEVSGADFTASAQRICKFRKEEFLLCVFFAVVPRSCRLIYLLNKVPNVEVSDTRGDAMKKQKARYKKYFDIISCASFYHIASTSNLFCFRHFSDWFTKE